jgi:uncharacterized protein YbjT (DUF2867 family)
MRVMVTGATGNAGTATMRALAADERVTSLVGWHGASPVPTTTTQPGPRRRGWP